jgi:ribosomal protein S18 acetylase RimI-like enzyme
MNLRRAVLLAALRSKGRSAVLSRAIRIREYVPEDFEAIFALDQRCFDADTAYSRDDLNIFLTMRDSIAYVAELRRKIVGFVIAQRYRAQPAIQARIITLDVAPEAQRKGIATRLMDTAEAKLSELGVGRVRLEVSVENASAQALYGSRKYAPIGLIPHYYHHRVDGLVMEKELAANQF